MRRLSLLLLPLLIASARAQNPLVESSATVSLTLWQSGTETTKPGKQQTVVHTAALETFRLGNREILENLLADGALQTETIAGWRIVALWANWPDAAPYAGNGYRFFVRRGKGSAAQSIAIPAAYLSLEPLVAAAGRRTVVSGETVRSGTAKFVIHEEFRFGLEGHNGILSALLTGTGRDLRPAGSDLSYFVPLATKATLQGTYEDTDPAAAGVVRGKLSLGAAKFVPGSDYKDTLGPVQGVSSVGAGSIRLGSNGTPGGGTILGGNLTVLRPSLLPGTFTLSQALTITFSEVPASTGTLTGVLAFAVAGTLTLGTGETLTLEAGDTLALNTLTPAQLSPLAWVPVPASG